MTNQQYRRQRGTDGPACINPVAVLEEYNQLIRERRAESGLTASTPPPKGRGWFANDFHLDDGE